MQPRHPPTDRQRHALMLAYSEHHVLYGYGDEFTGVSPNTTRSLLARGWVVPIDPDDIDDELVITRTGKRVLGLTGVFLRKPKRMKTAVVRAVGYFVYPEPKLRAATFRPEKLNSTVWVNDEQKADFSDALLVVDMSQADLVGLADDELSWACAATLVSELGFPCYVSRTRYVQAFWPDED